MKLSERNHVRSPLPDLTELEISQVLPKIAYLPYVSPPKSRRFRPATYPWFMVHPVIRPTPSMIYHKIDVTIMGSRAHSDRASPTFAYNPTIT